MEPVLKRWLGYPSVQIALCVLVYLAATWRLGPSGMVIASPLLGAAIARPIMNLVANLRHAAREATWLPVHGHHFVFKDVTIGVLEDEDHCRWVRLADVRKAAGITASDRVLATVYPGRVKVLDEKGDMHMRDDALVELLGKETDAVALRFRTWIDRTVAHPAGQVRKRLGIRPEPPIG